MPLIAREWKLISVITFKEAQHLLYDLLYFGKKTCFFEYYGQNIDLRDNKGHAKGYLITKRNFFPFLKMWKFGLFLKSRFLPDYKTCGTSTEKLQHFQKIKFISACKEKR